MEIGEAAFQSLYMIPGDGSGRLECHITVNEKFVEQDGCCAAYRTFAADFDFGQAFEMTTFYEEQPCSYVQVTGFRITDMDGNTLPGLSLVMLPEPGSLGTSFLGLAAAALLAIRKKLR